MKAHTGTHSVTRRKRRCHDHLLLAIFAVTACGAAATTASAGDEGFPPDWNCGKSIEYMVSVPSQIIHSEHATPAQKTLGMTSSTIDLAFSSITVTTVCLDNAGAALLALHHGEQQRFAQHNALAMVQQMAQGGGPEMRAMAQLMGCSPEGGAQLALQAQAHFEQLAADGLDGLAVWQNLGQVARGDPKVQAGCPWA